MSTEEPRDSLERLMAAYDTEPKEWPADSHEGVAESQSPSECRRRSFVRHLIPPLIYLVLLAVGCTFGFLCGRLFPPRHIATAEENIYSKYAYKQCMIWLSNSESTANYHIPAPAFAAIASEPSVISPTVHIGPNNPYSGAPNEVSNAHWERLLSGSNLSILKLLTS